jgi:hypothetical protein
VKHVGLHLHSIIWLGIRKRIFGIIIRGYDILVIPFPSPVDIHLGKEIRMITEERLDRLEDEVDSIINAGLCFKTIRAKGFILEDRKRMRRDRMILGKYGPTITQYPAVIRRSGRLLSSPDFLLTRPTPQIAVKRW